MKEEHEELDLCSSVTKASQLYVLFIEMRNVLQNYVTRYQTISSKCQM